MHHAGGMTHEPQSQGKDAIRPANLSAMLRVLLREGPLSRSELISLLSLSRTTIAELSAQLVELGLVGEQAPQLARGVGRPSNVVHLADEVVSFAVNPELDSVSVGVVGLSGELLGVRRFAETLLADPEAVADLASAAIAELWKSLPREVRAIGCGVAVPGQVPSGLDAVQQAPSLGWQDVDFGRILGDRLEIPVRVDNNARLVMRAEQRLGVARGIRNVIYVYAGAGGIGGGIVSSGQMLTGVGGFAGEIGHMMLSFRGDEGGSIVRGTFESLVRRGDLERALGLGLLSDELLDEQIATNQESLFLRLAADQVQALCEVLTSLANLLDPEAIVLGGFLGSLYQRFNVDVDTFLEVNVIESIGASLQVRIAGDASSMALRGAAELLWDELIANPIGIQVFRSHEGTTTSKAVSAGAKLPPGF